MSPGQYTVHYWSSAGGGGRRAVLQRAGVAHARRRHRRRPRHAHRRGSHRLPRDAVCWRRRVRVVGALGRRQGGGGGRRGADGAQPLHRPAGGRAVRARARRAARARRRDAHPHGQQGLLKQRRGERQDAGRPAVRRVRTTPADGDDATTRPLALDRPGTLFTCSVHCYYWYDYTYEIRLPRYIHLNIV